MNPMDRIVEDVAALRKKVDAERTTLRLGSVQPSGTVALPDGGQVTPASSVGALTTGDRVLVAQHNRRAYVIGTAGPNGSYNPHLNIYVPSGTSMAGWRNRVHAARAGRSTTVAVIGSSSVAGTGADVVTEGWAWLLRDLFADAGYPIQGTGLAHVGAAKLISNPLWTFSGAITVPGDGGFTPKLHASIPSGAWAQYAAPVTGDRVRVWYLNDGGAFDISVNGGAATAITPSGAASTASWTSGALSTALHTVRVTGTGGTAALVLGVEAYKTPAASLGINVTVAGISGTTSSAWYSGGHGSALDAALKRVPALCIVAVNGNDFSLGVSRETMLSRYATLVGNLRFVSTEPLLVLMPHVETQDLAAYRAHAAVLYEIADLHGVALVDMLDRWGSYAQADAAGLFDDGVHPSTRGHELYARAIFDVIGR